MASDAASSDSSSLTAIEHLSRYALSLSFRDLPAAAVDYAVTYLADSLACALAAANQAEIKAMAATYGVRRDDHFASDSSASSASSSAACRPIWGTRLVATAAHASLCNSSLIRCLDANDLYAPPPPQNMLSTGHCSDALGGVLALVDPKQNTGQQLLTAVVLVRKHRQSKHSEAARNCTRSLLSLSSSVSPSVSLSSLRCLPQAYEVQAALSTTMVWIERGLHSLSQVNFAVPAAAAAFPQYKLDAPTLTSAMALSASTGMCLQAWLKTKSKPHVAGSSSSANASVPTVKFVSPGLACSRGIESLTLARLCGVTANPDALETLSFFFNEPGRSFDPAPFANLRGAPTMHRHLIKQYAAQFNLQAAISCALQLHARGVRLDRLSSLRIEGHSFVCGGVQGASEAFTPSSQGSADHSTPFVVVAALMHGQFEPKSAYEHQPWLRADVRAHMARITLVVDPELEAARVSSGALGVRMHAQMSDGTSVAAEQLTTLGHPDAPLSAEQLRDKWAAMLSPLYGEGMAQRLWEACTRLKTSVDSDAVQALEELLATEPTSTNQTQESAAFPSTAVSAAPKAAAAL